MPEILLTVSREGPIVATTYEGTPNLLEAVAAAAMVLVGVPDVNQDVRLCAASLLSAIRAPDLAPASADQAIDFTCPHCQQPARVVVHAGQAIGEGRFTHWGSVSCAGWMSAPDTLVGAALAAREKRATRTP